MATYNAPQTEEKWQKLWAEKKLYETNLEDGGKKAKPKYYNLVMFPYPSGDKLHIGHWYNYAPADSWGRYMRMKGFNVLEPIGFDSFGLPAENYAVKHGVPPRETTEKNIEYMRKQLRAMGTMYDWDKEVVTSHPEYYKWTQWVFLELYKKGLAYRKKAAVNWCPSCQTVLANEQVQDGVCERCKTEVTKKDLTQWFFKIKSYAEDLLNFEGLDWPARTKMMQEHWIGRSEGSEIDFELLDENGKKSGKKVTVFTTRADTLFGVTYVVLAPEHELVKEITLKANHKAVDAYIEHTKKITDINRSAEGREKTGVFTGAFALHPLTGEKVPVWIADYVLIYGTGAVMAVPAHDQRDFDFAKQYMLPFKTVIKGEMPEKEEAAMCDYGVLIDSDIFTGLKSEEAIEEITKQLKHHKQGNHVVNYKLRDWLVSRQRYWGAPIPMIRCEKCGDVPVPVKELPVLLPEKGVDYKPQGKSPLASVPDFVNVECPKCGGDAEREVDTMDTFVDSSWYFLRYLASKNTENAFDMSLNKKWMPVDMYIGGPEHACMHLLYARFIHKALMNDKKSEPFKRLVHQGLITKDGAKMSKSKGNVVSPDAFVEKYGSDVFRLYLMFLGPFVDGGDWNDKGIVGIARFVDRFFSLVTEPHGVTSEVDSVKLVHQTIKKVTEDIEKLQFNTAIAALMEFVNGVKKVGISNENLELMIKLIAPIAPHLAEEMWEQLGMTFSVLDTEWPVYDAELVKDDKLKIAVQVNGKLRGVIEVDVSLEKEKVLELARAEEGVKKYLEGKTLIKEIFVPAKLVSFVVKD